MTLSVPPFAETLRARQLSLVRNATEILQVNVGKLCNQACQHCHVEAGPTRKERLELATWERIRALLEKTPGMHTVDFTGGAPELNPYFRQMVTDARALGKNVIDRCNLTVFFESGQESTPQFLADHRVMVVASLPCYSEKNVDTQRGRGVFDKSIEALKILNSLGYGKTGSGLSLALVYNPVGAFLPPPQATLEEQYKRELREHFNIEFNQLYTITNMPIKRFLKDLQRTQKLESYEQLLYSHFNAASLPYVMCRNLVSVGWDGALYDCDFNQMLEMPIAETRTTVWDVDSFAAFMARPIAMGDHCYGCTAGTGSSCSGALTS